MMTANVGSRGVIGLDRAGRDERCGGEAGDGLRCQRASAEAREAAETSAGRGRAGSHSGRGSGAAARGPGDVARTGRGGRAELCENQLLEHQKRRDWQDRRQRVVVVLEVLLEGAAAFTAAYVAARGRADLDQPLSDFPKL
jgi:hypothetical protein